MSEQWHQHLQNLTWWEEIDRFFNPSKYSCSTFTYTNFDLLFQTLFILIIVFSVGYLVLMFWIKRYNNAEDSSTDTQQEAELTEKPKDDSKILGNPIEQKAVLSNEKEPENNRFTGFRLSSVKSEIVEPKAKSESVMTYRYLPPNLSTL